MGTRSLTKIIQRYDDHEEQVLTTMYRQMDGYPEGHGIDLATWLYPFNMVNGIGLDEERQIANGADCLAAQMFAHFKNGPGGIYLMHPDAHDCGEEYTYFVNIQTDDSIIITVLDNSDDTIIFTGEPRKLVVKYA